MRTLLTDAIVVSDPQVKVSTKGKEYIEFRCVNHDNNEDFWFTCVGFQPQLINFIKNYFKKGSRILVNGGFKDNAYKTKEGEVGIDRSVVLFDATFTRDGSKQNEAQPQQQSQKQSDMDSMTSESKAAEPKKTSNKKKDAPKAPVVVEDDESDDLPF